MTRTTSSPRTVTAWAICSTYSPSYITFWKFHDHEEQQRPVLFETKKEAIKLCTRLNKMIDCYHVVRLAGRIPVKRGKGRKG